MSKPSIAELLIASGHTDFNSPLLQQAIQTLYGDVGANLDERDWSAIMATNNPMAVAEQALKDQWQDAAYLLRNADHLIGQSYSPVSVEFTYRQMADRLDFAYDASWSAGTQYAWLGALSGEELAARAAAEAAAAEVPRIAFEFTDTAANLDVSHAGTLSFSVAGASQTVSAGDVALTPGATLREGFVTLTPDSGEATTTDEYVVVGTNTAMSRRFGTELPVVDRLIILGSASDSISAGDSNDTVYGGDGADIIVGNSGNDLIRAGTGADQIAGSEGNDTINGGSGNDFIVLLETNPATDVVIFSATAGLNGSDTILGFTTGFGGDVLNTAAFSGGGAMTLDATIYSATVANPTTLADDTVVRLVDLTGGENISTEAGLAAALTVGGEYANLDANTNADADTIVFLTASSTTATAYSVFYATAAVTSIEFGSVTLVGTVDASGALSTLVPDNFI